MKRWKSTGCNQETDNFPTSCRKVKGGNNGCLWKKKAADTPSVKMKATAAAMSDFP